MRLLDWLTGRDLEQPAEAPQEPADADPRDGASILPTQEPRKPQSTAERKARGIRARIQRDEIEAALDRMALNAAKQWAESAPSDTAKREEAYRLVGVIRALRTELQSVVSDGEMAAAEEQIEARRNATRPADNRE